MINIDLSNGVPIVEQIVIKMSNLIIAGAFPNGEKLMTVSELSKTLTTSFNNVSQAYKQLEDKGLIYCEGEDFYVGKPKPIIKENNTEIDTKVTKVNKVNKAQNIDGVLKNLENNIAVLLENDFSEDYLIEVINKQESLLKVFEKNTALLLQQGIEKEDLVNLVKTINSRKL